MTIEYLVLATKQDAEALIAKIDAAWTAKQPPGTTTWSQAIQHPINEQCLVPVDLQRLAECAHLFDGIEAIGRRDAKFRGWYLGWYTGSLAREKQKLEDVHFIFDALVGAHGNPNFPALRALTHSFLSACYSLKESLKQKSNHEPFKSKWSGWWPQRAKEMDAKGELLHSFERFMNTEKHGGALSGQHANLDLEPRSVIGSLIVTHAPPQADLSTLHLSAEGAFVNMYRDTWRERRMPVGIHDAHYEVLVEEAPKKHLANSIEGFSFLQMMEAIRDYYSIVIFDGAYLIGEGPTQSGSIQFSGDQFLACSPMIKR